MTKTLHHAKKIVSKAKQQWLFLLLILIVAVLVIASYTTKGIAYDLANSDLEAVVDYIQGFGVLAAVVYVGLVILEVIVAPFPPLILYVAAGLIFGTWYGGLLALLGNVVGAMIAFLLARTFGRDIIKEKIKPSLQKKFDVLTKKYGMVAIFLLRINPFTSSDVVSYLAGLSTMRLRSLAIGTALGLLPLVFLQTYLGEELITQYPVLGLLFIVIGIVYIIAFIFGLYYLFKKK